MQNNNHFITKLRSIYCLQFIMRRFLFCLRFIRQRDWNAKCIERQMMHFYVLFWKSIVSFVCYCFCDPNLDFYKFYMYFRGFNEENWNIIQKYMIYNLERIQEWEVMTSRSHNKAMFIRMCLLCLWSCLTLSFSVLHNSLQNWLSLR